MEKAQFIQSFLKQKKIAIAGVSRDKKKFGRYVFNELTKNGYSIAPINRNTTEIDGIRCFNSFNDLKEKYESALITVKPTETLSAVESAVNAGIKNIWIQQGSESDEAIKFCKEKNIPFISNECIMMYAEPVKSMHSFHHFIWKLIGKYHK